MKPTKILRPLLLTVFVLFAALPAEAQNPARKFDEFGDIQYSDLIARLDNFAIQLQQEPDTRGFIVIYRTRRDLPGLSHRLAMRMKEYLFYTRGLGPDRLVTVDGGVAENLVQEFWIALPGTTPQPRSDARIGYLESHDSAWKFDEQGYLPRAHYPKFGIRFDVEREAEYLETYANAVKQKPGQIACLIAYAQYTRKPRFVDYAGDYQPRRETRLDPAGTARKHLAQQRKFLINVYGLPASRIKTIDGGYRKSRAIEFWIVPEGEPLPIPTPNAFPFRKTRKK
jgi:hypothetical protein